MLENSLRLHALFKVYPKVSDRYDLTGMHN